MQFDKRVSTGEEIDEELGAVVVGSKPQSNPSNGISQVAPQAQEDNASTRPANRSTTGKIAAAPLTRSGTMEEKLRKRASDMSGLSGRGSEKRASDLSGDGNKFRFLG